MTVEISEKAYEDATAALSRGNDDLDLRGLHEAVARGMAEDAIDAAQLCFHRVNHIAIT